MLKLRRGFLSSDFEWLAKELYTENACQYFPIPGTASLAKACGRKEISGLYEQIVEAYGTSGATIIYKSEDKRSGRHSDRFFVMDFCMGPENAVYFQII